MKDVPVFERELNALVRLSEKNDTFMELYRPEDGAPDGLLGVFAAATAASPDCAGSCHRARRWGICPG